MNLAALPVESSEDPTSAAASASAATSTAAASIPGTGTSTSNPTTNPGNTSSIHVDDIDADFLPLIYETVKCVERDPSDAAAKNKESVDASAKIQELSRRLETAKAQVRRLPGIGLNPEEQKAQLAALKRQLALKQELVYKYHALGDLSTFLNVEVTSSGASTGTCTATTTSTTTPTTTGVASSHNGTPE